MTNAKSSESRSVFCNEGVTHNSRSNTSFFPEQRKGVYWLKTSLAVERCPSKHLRSETCFTRSTVSFKEQLHLWQLFNETKACTASSRCVRARELVPSAVFDLGTIPGHIVSLKTAPASPIAELFDWGFCDRTHCSPSSKRKNMLLYAVKFNHLAYCSFQRGLPIILGPRNQ